MKVYAFFLFLSCVILLTYGMPAGPDCIVDTCTGSILLESFGLIEYARLEIS